MLQKSSLIFAFGFLVLCAGGFVASTADGHGPLLRDPDDATRRKQVSLLMIFSGAATCITSAIARYIAQKAK
ncbi:MAG: hypothetical protein JSS02_01375 [Planctomycetes bacterium]|nr:hypothetical protein [Planctomycetota bacterium]